MSGDLGGVFEEQKGEVIRLLCRFLEQQLTTSS